MVLALLLEMLCCGTRRGLVACDLIVGWFGGLLSGCISVVLLDLVWVAYWICGGVGCFFVWFIVDFDVVCGVVVF